MPQPPPHCSEPRQGAGRGHTPRQGCPEEPRFLFFPVKDSPQGPPTANRQPPTANRHLRTRLWGGAAGLRYVLPPTRRSPPHATHCASQPHCTPPQATPLPPSHAHVHRRPLPRSCGTPTGPTASPTHAHPHRSTPPHRVPLPLPSPPADLQGLQPSAPTTAPPTEPKTPPPPGLCLKGGVPPPPPPQGSSFNSTRRHVRNPNATPTRFQPPVTAPQPILQRAPTAL